MISLIQKQRDDLLTVLHSQNDETIGRVVSDTESLSSTLLANKKTLRFAVELSEKGSVEDMLLNYGVLNARVTRIRSNLTGGSSVFDDSTGNDVSPATLINNVCTSLDSQSKS